jgi:CRISPR-associated protein Cst1
VDKKASPESEDPFRRRNYLYEDLFGLPENAARFIRRYLRPRDMTGQEGAEFVPTWRLTELFLEEVMGMEAKRIEAIRALADRLSEKVAQTDDKALWKKAYFNKGYRGLRNLLISQGQQLLKDGRPPLLRLDDFLAIFEDGNELAKADWGLAWDLVLIRMTEQLYDRGWFERHKDVLAETTEEAEREEE